MGEKSTKEGTHAVLLNTKTVTDFSEDGRLALKNLEIWLPFAFSQHKRWLS